VNLSATLMSGKVIPADPATDPVKKLENDTELEAVLEKYEELKLSDGGKLDQFWIWPEDSRPELPIKYDVELPIVDLSPVLKLRDLQKNLEQSKGQAKSADIEGQIKLCLEAKKEVEKAIRTGCEEFGFFQIVNHGFPISLVERLKKSYSQLFALPLEVKISIQSCLASIETVSDCLNRNKVIRLSRLLFPYIASNQVQSVDYCSLTTMIADGIYKL
jgi:hypothetical protein